MIDCCLGLVQGRVQGVWFRRFVQRAALAYRVQGYARNLPDGSVEVLLLGDPEALARVREQVAIGPRAAQVERITWQRLEPPLPTVEDFQVL